MDEVKQYNKIYVQAFHTEEIFAHAITARSKKDNWCRFVAVFNFNTPKNCSKVTHGVIAHEALHITSFIMDLIGQKFKHHNHEEFTYLIQWVTNEIYKLLEAHKIIIGWKP